MTCKSIKARREFLVKQIKRIDKSIKGRQAVLNDQIQMQQRYMTELEEIDKN